MAIRSIREFIKLESSAGIILFVAALLALIIDNTAFAREYEALFRITLSFSVGQFTLTKPLLLWVNDGLMSIFFLLMGLEIKRELIEGELNSFSKASLPAIAAIGGMIVPSAIYLILNWHNPITLKGWAIPTATDTAFALAILTLLGRRIPVSLKIFLTMLAIFDDIGAIIVMAVFYSQHISFVMLWMAGFFIVILLLLNYFKVQKLGPYFVVGFMLWLCVLNSGVHATLAGILLAFMIPLRPKRANGVSPLHLLEDKLHPWVVWFVLPIFAFANAGVPFNGIELHHLYAPVPLGIALGLFLGKQIGIWCATMLGVRCGAPLPKDMTPLSLYGLSLVAGVGFTMSLFIGTLAFHSVAPYAAFVRIGVIMGSLLSGFLGYWILRRVYPGDIMTAVQDF